MLERDVEKYLKKAVEAMGGECFKWVCPQVAGVPDRIILIKGKVYFVELKRPVGGVWPSLQIRFAKWLNENGFDFSLVQSKVEADMLIDRIRRNIE